MSLKRVKQGVFFHEKKPTKEQEVLRYVKAFDSEFMRWQQEVSEFMTSLKYFKAPNYDTTERDAQEPTELELGQFIYNTDLNKLQVWTGSAWETVSSA